MKKRLGLISCLAIAGWFAPVSATAQAPQAASATPAGPGQQQPQKQFMDMATAKKMVAAAEAAATAANAHVAIAVVDANGDVVYFERMDGAPHMAVTTSQGKARAAILFGEPTAAVHEAMTNAKPLSATLTNPLAGAWEITIQQGGLPVIKDGMVIAGIGCGGSAPANDEKFAQAGIDAISTK